MTSLQELPDHEIVAAEVLAAAGVEAFPIETEGVSKLWPMLHVCVTPLDRPGYLVDFGDNGTEIVVRQQDSESRRRYTIAHELGHFVLHKRGIPHAYRGEEAIEKWCNGFAAALLMPRQAMLEYLRGAGMRKLVNRVQRGHKFFRVSRKAFRLRVAEVTPMTLASTRLLRDRVEVVEVFGSRQCTVAATKAAVDGVVQYRKLRGAWPSSCAGVTHVLSARESDTWFLVLVHKIKRFQG